VGRYKINKKLNLNHKLEQKTLTKDDIIEIINRGKVNYATATDSMAAAEQAQSAAFPG
jgi:hypothetical protein